MVKSLFVGALTFVAVVLLLTASCAVNKIVAKPSLVVIEEDEPLQTGMVVKTPAVNEDAAKTSPVAVNDDLPRAAWPYTTPTIDMQELTTPIHFDLGSVIINEDAARRLQNKAMIMQLYPAISVTIAGHSDDRGPAVINMTLSTRRAKAAKEYLEALGVDSSRIDTVSYGGERPVDSSSNEAAWAKNRRDEFLVHRH